MRFFGVDLFLSELLLVSAVPQRATISSEVPHVEDVTNETPLNELMCFAVGSDPLQGPVYHECSVRGHRTNHAVSFLERTGKWFFDDDVDTERGDFLHPFSVLGRGWAENDNIRRCFREAFCVVGEDAFAGNLEFADGVLHPLGLEIADSD